MSETAPGRWGDPEFHEWWAREYVRRAYKQSGSAYDHEFKMEYLTQAQVDATLAVSARLRLAAERNLG